MKASAMPALPSSDNKLSFPCQVIVDGRAITLEASDVHDQFYGRRLRRNYVNLGPPSEREYTQIDQWLLWLNGNRWLIVEQERGKSKYTGKLLPQQKVVELLAAVGYPIPRELLTPIHQLGATPEDKPPTPPPTGQRVAAPAGSPAQNDSMARLLRLFTNGVVDDQIKKASSLVEDDALNVNDKLTKINSLIPFPANASAEHLAELLGVTKQAVLKTAWWIENRRGEKQNEIGRRRAVHKERAKGYQPCTRSDDDEYR
jgi:hypothetical protein